MPERERVNLTDAAIARLRPGVREYTVWDSRLLGLGVRVRPTGGQSFVLLQCAAGRSRRVSLGPVTTMTIAEARRECHVLMTEPEAAGAVPARAVPLFRDFVAGEWKEARFERLKPSTKKGVVSVLEGQLLPAFGSKPLDRITLVRIRRWFDDFSRTAPGNANHALDLLRRIMNFAIACGHVDNNPARDIKPNPRPTLIPVPRVLEGTTPPHGRRSRSPRAPCSQSARDRRSLHLTPGSLPIAPTLDPMGQIIDALHVPDQIPPARAQSARFRGRPPYLDRRVLRRVRPDAGAASLRPATMPITPGHLRPFKQIPSWL